MESIIKKSLDAFFEKVREQCLDESTEPLVETLEIKGLTDEDVEYANDYLEDLTSNDDCDYEICGNSFWDPVIGETLYLRKSITYDLSAQYCNGALSLIANFRYYYEKYGWGDTLEISEEDYNATLEEHIDDDIFGEDEDEYPGDMPCEMHYVGDGVWCDDDGDNWDFD